MRWGPLAIVALILVPPAGAWTQLRGEADRSSAIDPPSGVLDVVPLAGGIFGKENTYALYGRASPLAVEARGGLTVLAGRAAGATDGCETFTVTPTKVLVRAVPDCAQGRLQGHAAAQDLLIACGSGPAAQRILSAYDADGGLAWQVVPRDAFPIATGATERRLDDDWAWSCDGAAVLDDAVVVPFLATQTGSDGARHRIAKVGLADGVVQWATEIIVSPALATPAQPEAVTALPGSHDTNPSFLPLAVAASGRGFLVSGLVACPVPPDIPSAPAVPDQSVCRTSTGQGDLPPRRSVGYLGAVAWLDVDGVARGFEAPRPPDQVYNDLGSTLPPPVVSLAGAADATLVFTQIGARVIAVDPGNARIEKMAQVTAFESSDGLGSWPIPLVQDQRIVVATDRRVNFLDASLNALGSWETQPTERVVDLAGDRLGRLFILSIDTSIHAGSDLSSVAKVTILGREGSEVLHDLPLPAATVAGTDPIFQSHVGDVGVDETQNLRWMRPPAFVEHDGELAVVDAGGGLFALRDVSHAPALDPSNAYPRPGDQVQVGIDWDLPARQVRLRWGDGTFEEMAWTGGHLEVDHLYPSPGRRELLVTVVGPDDASATGQLVFEVGGVQPPQTLWQKALARENADMTWGLFGLALAALGAAWGYLRVRHGRWRLQRMLADVQAARELGREDPLGALSRLKEARQRIEGGAAHGRIEQAQLHMLESRVASASRALLHQSVAGFRTRLTPAYQGMLAGFFEDGRMGPHELEAALAGLRRQVRLDPGERDRLQRMFGILRD